MAWRETEAREGINDGVGWLWRPSSDDSGAIEQGFCGRSMMDGCVVREKVRYFCTYLTKKSGFVQLTFFNRSLGDLEVSFLIEYPYLNLICRA
jgi:hypothetical protein